MKKLTILFVLMLVLAYSTFAGDTPIGGKTCPQGQTTCLVDTGETPADKTTLTTIIMRASWKIFRLLF